MPLDDYADALSYEVAFTLASVYDATQALDEVSEASLDAADKLRAMAILVLLAHADSDTFYHNLIRSGRAREVILRRCLQEGATTLRHYCQGRLEPLLDAIAAGELALAQRIVQAGPPDFREEVEYEDDYAYARLLGAFASGRPDPSEVVALLDRFERYLDGQESGRLEACRALHARDAAAFEEALLLRIRERDEEIAEDKARSQLVEPPVTANRAVFIEGLALLRLATALGLPTQPDYPMSPSIARVPMVRPFPGE